MTTRLDRFLAKVDRRGDDECWPWTAGKTDSGHGQFWDGHRHIYAHRYSFGLINKITPGKFVLHKCNNPSCCNWRHLYEGTKKDNSRDSMLAGTNYVPDNRGERHGMAKLTDSDVAAIRSMDLSQRKIAKQFSISQAAVWKIKSNTGWKHI